jgi:peptidoglycan/LPS O-acetylase OafA/YrhL
LGSNVHAHGAPGLEKKGDIASLTTIRGLAALWVVVFHVWPMTKELLPGLGWLTPLAEAGFLAVPMFFVLSGYVLALRYVEPLGSPTPRDVGRFLVLRLGRVYPVHVVMLLASVAIFARHGFPPDDDGHSPRALVANLALVHAWSRTFAMSWNYPSWSISSEWFAYLVFPVIAVFASRASRALMGLTAVVCCLAGAAVYHHESVPFQALAQVIPTFTGGVVLARLFPPRGAERPGVQWGAIGLLVVALVVPFFASRLDTSSVLVVVFFAVVGLLGSAGHHNLAVWRWAPLALLGDISYSLYMVHELVISVVTKVIGGERLMAASALVRGAAILACIALSLVVAFASYHVIERPCREASRRLLTRKARKDTVAT